jgi:G:T/U mismatch-specific DNA glycosylase
MDNGIEAEAHPLKPFLPHNATLLMLGSFPPQKKRWSMDFYYPNMQNDMWRIFGIVFFNDKEYFINKSSKAFDKEKITDFLQLKGIALYDTATVVKRLKDNASDKFLEVIEPTDIMSLLKEIPLCRGIVTTGQKATDTILMQIGTLEPRVGYGVPFTIDGKKMHFFRMPSSSRAYPLALEKKADYYRLMFSELDIL